MYTKPFNRRLFVSLEAIDIFFFSSPSTEKDRVIVFSI